ncbi:hypothetical protein [Aeromonas sp. QDB03]|uniref:hypothetical protein n=1 Tax=Aeromonas sp. QDB03 TaxID=2989839 RepID=UPI0022E5C5E7|nr:hypothetical protein [Aeromonas sp. QDB03]
MAQTITFRPNEARDPLNQLVAATGSTPSKIIRQAIREMAARQLQQTNKKPDQQ